MKLHEACKAKKEKTISKTWEELNAEFGYPYKNGESLRAAYKGGKIKDGDAEAELKPSKTRVGANEVKPEAHDKGEYYLVVGRNQSIEITKDNLRRLKELYCLMKMTINEVCLELNIPRDEFYLIKTAFGITKDDVPVIDEELENLDEAVEKTLQQKKRLFKVKLQHKEIKDTQKELTKYKTREYWLDKIREIADEIKPLEFTGEVVEAKTNNQGLLCLADWHTGMKVANYWNVYNSDVLRKRAKELVRKTLYDARLYNICRVHVFNLGDLVHGLIHTSTRVEAEFDVAQQIRVAIDILSGLLVELSNNIREVVFYSTYGNHSRFTSNKKDALDNENFELLLPLMLGKLFAEFPNIKYVPNEVDEQWIVADICGHVIIGTHGDRDPIKKSPSNITMMYKKPYKVFCGHGHRVEELTEHGVNAKMVGSMCGVETYAKDLRKTSVPSQKFCVFNKIEMIHEHDIELDWKG
jgi:hypothetical protein